MTKDELTKVKCNICDGDGWTAEHDPYDPHEYGCSNCPIQVQCENCHGEGFFYLIDEVHSLLGSLVPELKTEKDKLLQRYFDISQELHSAVSCFLRGDKEKIKANKKRWLELDEEKYNIAKQIGEIE